MKKIVLTGSVIMMAMALVTGLSSCQKAKTTTSTPADDTALQTQNASDDTRVSSELDNATTDEVTAMSNTVNISGRMSSTGLSLACDAKLDTTQFASGILTINYDSTGCNLITKRSGSITLQIINYKSGMRWKTPGATVGISFNNYRVERISDGKYIIFNGSKSIENVNGGLFTNITTSFSLVHKIRVNNLTITFDDGTKRQWSVSRTTTWSSPVASAYMVNVTGDTTVGSLTNVSMWGVNRAGNTFSEQLTTPYSANSVCDWYRPTSGAIVLTGLAHSLTITYGVDLSGAVWTGAPCGASGFKFNWTNPAGVARQVVIPYL